MRICKWCGASEEETYFDARGLQCKRCRNGLKRYGLHTKQQEELFEKQNKKCAFCGTDQLALHVGRGNKSAVVDHCHETGRVRGIVCGVCNGLFGGFEKVRNLVKEEDFMKKLNEYLQHV